MSKIQASDDLDMYNAESMTELIDFKWNSYAYNWHLVGCCFHFFYLLILNIYIYRIYIKDPELDHQDGALNDAEDDAFH